MRSSLVLIVSFLGASAFPVEDKPAFNAEYSRVEGDMILSDEDLVMIRGKRGAPDVSNPAKMWPTNQVISWKFDSSYDAVFSQSIRDAFKFWSDNTCLTYQENGSTTPLIKVTKGSDCSSQLGRQGGASQVLNLDDGCDKIGTIVHEIGHSLGLYHTHMRFDRDSYITINFDNIPSAAMRNFDKLTQQANNNFGVDYDYSSVMHYDAYGFAVDKNIVVIKTKDPFAQTSTGQRERAAFTDIKLINLMYNCAQKCPSATVKCQNGGIINSKTCNSCICPYMWTGSDCSQRTPSTGPHASGCGQDLTATTSWQNVQGTFGAYATSYNATSCYWNFKAPAGKKIEVRVNNVEFWCGACKYNAIHFFTRGFATGGYQFCCPEKDNIKGKTFQSVDNGFAINLAATYSNPKFNVDYRFV